MSFRHDSKIGMLFNLMDEMQVGDVLALHFDKNTGMCTSISATRKAGEECDVEIKSVDLWNQFSRPVLALYVNKIKKENGKGYRTSKSGESFTMLTRTM